MSRSLESSLVNKFKKCLAPLVISGDVWFVKTNERAMKGIPDMLLCVLGELWALEFKRYEGLDAEPLQRYNLDAINKAGGKVFLVHPGNWVEVYTLILERINEHKTRR